MSAILDSPAEVTARRGTPRYPSRLARHLWHALLLALVLAILLIVISPLITIVLGSLWSALFLRQPGTWTFQHYIDVFTSGQLSLLTNTVVMTAGASLLAMAVGVILAWIVARTDVPFKSVLRWLPVCSLVLTALFRDVAWIELYSPNVGLVNVFATRVLGFSSAPFNIYSMPGMIVSIGLNLAPITYFILLTPMSTVSAHLDEASRTCGAGRARSFLQITLPMLRPGLLSAFTITAVIVASSFETPVIIGLPAGIRTYMSAIYESMNGGSTPNYDLASAQAVVYLILTLALLIWYRRSTRVEKKYALLAGRGQNTSLIRLGPWRWVAVVVVVVEFIVSFLQLAVITVLVSLVPFYSVTAGNPFKRFTLEHYSSVFSVAGTLGAIRNSFVVGIVTSVVCAFVALLLAVVAFKSHARGRRWVELIGTMPIAIPPLVFSVALLLTVLSVPAFVPMYNTPYLLVIAEVVVFLPYALRIIATSVVTVGDELIEASAASGARALRSVRSIIIPLVAPAMVNAVGVVLMLSLRELGAVVLIVPLNMNLMPSQIFSIYQTGNYGAVNAFNVISVAATLLVVVVAAGLYNLVSKGIGRFRFVHGTD